MAAAAAVEVVAVVGGGGGGGGDDFSCSFHTHSDWGRWRLKMKALWAGILKDLSLQCESHPPCEGWHGERGS